MKGAFIFLAMMILNVPDSGKECYSIEAALENPDQVKSLFLNYTFLEIKQINPSIGELKNLERFEIFGRMFDFPKIQENKLVSNKLDDSVYKTPIALPDEISQCVKLKYIDISKSEIKNLPQNIVQLQKLETLHLSFSKINLDEVIDEILSLKSLKELFIIDLEIKEENLARLRMNSQLKIYQNEIDWAEYISECVPLDVQLHDTYLAFHDAQLAHRFVNSLPKDFPVEPRFIERKK